MTSSRHLTTYHTFSGLATTYSTDLVLMIFRVKHRTTIKNPDSSLVNT